MKTQLALIAGLSAVSVAAAAAPVTDKASPAQPVKLTQAQLDKIVAGNPNELPNGTNQNSNGASGSPGGSFGAPGQTNNPNPGK
jgi:hypothetical protein